MDDTEEKNSTSSSSDDSLLKEFYEDVPETDSENQDDETEKKNLKIFAEATNEMRQFSDELAVEGEGFTPLISIVHDSEVKNANLKAVDESSVRSVECHNAEVIGENTLENSISNSAEPSACPLRKVREMDNKEPPICDYHKEIAKLIELKAADESYEYIVNFLGQESDEAEARLAARRQARVEAREIRLRELERQQKEQEENADKVYDMSLASDNMLRAGRVAPLGLMNAKERPQAVVNSYHSSRRSSEDSLEDSSFCLRDIKHELKEVEEKFRKAMIANAQLDNEKSELTYQVELLKDRLEDLEETHAQLTRENKEKCREHEQLKRVAVKLKEELSFYKSQLEERDRLISDYGLVIVGGENEEGKSAERVLVSAETAGLLQEAGDGSLDVRLKKFAEERNELLDEIRHLKLELEEERCKKRSDSRTGYGSLANGPLDEETSKILSDYRFKLQKAEQDVSTLQANVARLESQVIRYKSAAESSEKAEDELKMEKRKLQRENRESIARIEELETANSHLMRRMDKLKNAKSTLLKEL